MNTAHLGDRLVERGEEILEDLQGDQWLKIVKILLGPFYNLKPRILIHFSDVVIIIRVSWGI